MHHSSPYSERLIWKSNAKFSMTSISQPDLPPQAPTSASQAIAPAHYPSASASGKALPQAAGTAAAPAKSSYASATKKPFSPSPASVNSTPSLVSSSSQHGKPDVSSVNGKTTIPPAVPSVTTNPIVNGNYPTNSSSGSGEHIRKPSVTISAAGASGYMPNGGPVAGKPKGGNGIQFGAVPEGSPQPAHSSLPPNQPMSSLAVSVPDPRVTSPQASPSPIPQPPASGGGRPPSNLHGNNSSVSFGNFNGTDNSVSKVLCVGTVSY